MNIRLITAIWCTSCLIMRPRYQQILSEHSDWTFEELDFDTEETVVSELHIGKVLPVAIIEKDQKEWKRIVGEKSLRELRQILEVR